MATHNVLSMSIYRWFVLMQGEQWILKHVPREINKAANCLVKMIFERDKEVCRYLIIDRKRFLKSYILIEHMTLLSNLN